MTTKLSEYERELADAKAKLQSAQLQVAAMTREAEELKQVVLGWESIIARERKQHGGGEFTVQNVVATAHLPAVDLSKDSPFDEDEDEGPNKTQFIRDRIRANGTNGTTTNDLKQAARAAGLEHAPSWPYGPLARLRKNGQVVRRKGKYYPGGGAQTGLALAG
jgi:hypothetical protein